MNEQALLERFRHLCAPGASQPRLSAVRELFAAYERALRQRDYAAGQAHWLHREDSGGPYGILPDALDPADAWEGMPDYIEDWVRETARRD